MDGSPSIGAGGGGCYAWQLFIVPKFIIRPLHIKNRTLEYTYDYCICLRLTLKSGYAGRCACTHARTHTHHMQLVVCVCITERSLVLEAGDKKAIGNISSLLLFLT